MKILQFPAYITINNKAEFCRSTTGYGYMSIAIATAIASLGVEVDLLTQSNITNGLYYNKVNILKRTFWDLFSSVKISNIVSSLRAIYSTPSPIRRIPKIVLYNISMGYFEKIVKQNNYDLVHIHGIGPYTIPIIETCENLDLKYIVTLHGLNSFSDSINISKREKALEKVFLNNADKNSIPVTVISSGIRSTILDFLKKPNSDTFHVVLNGCETDNCRHSPKINLREKYQIDTHAKIMLCVGNIGKNKNQAQILRAFSRLSKTYSDQIVILFLGCDFTNGRFLKEINDTNFKSRLIYCGNVAKDSVSDYYKQADYTIVASISEGFGLSIIEGFSYGLPCLTFRDLDAISDLYNRKAMLLVDHRTDEGLADGIEQLLTTEWNKDDIINHAMKFSLEKMAQNYLNIFSQIVIQ